MNALKMLLVQLLMLTWHISGKATVVDVEAYEVREPICRNSSLNFIVLIVCKINTRTGRVCQLLYSHQHGFVQECDRNMRLVMENQTVFLNLTSLKLRDSGSYFCECSSHLGTEKLHLNISVPGDEDTTSLTGSPLIYLLAGVIFFLIIITGIILRYIHNRIHHCSRREIEQPPSPPVPEHIEDIEPYSTFIQRENGLYSIAVINPRHKFKSADNIF